MNNVKSSTTNCISNLMHSSDMGHEIVKRIELSVFQSKTVKMAHASVMHARVSSQRYVVGGDGVKVL